MAKYEIPIYECYPVMALRGLTVFPNMLMHFDVGREKSAKALDAAMLEDQKIFLLTQRDIADDDPSEDQLYKIGTIAHIRQVLKMPGDSIRILVEGLARGSILDFTQTEPYLRANIEAIDETKPASKTKKTEAVLRTCYDLYAEYLDVVGKNNGEALLKVISSSDPGFIADYIAQNTTFKFEDKQHILEELNPTRRVEKLNKILANEIDILMIESSLNEQVQASIAKGQRDYYLREQMKVIKTELGEADDDDELAEYRKKVEKLNASDEIKEKLNKEVDRLAKQGYGSSESSVIRNYLDTCLEMPWGITTKEQVDIAKAKKILDADHYGLEKVKERILEFLAVKQLAPELSGQILCLVGPPGVGKTSVAVSIARCLNRKLARISLGGVRDEADIRGHRKTYVGAMPGRIISAVKQAGSMNPLILMDEIDKMGSDYRGDPSAALLEVFDTEQNMAFRDHFLELPFDLSDVVFITTANSTSTIPQPLLDRMELIELSSYTDEEKLQIAKNHLLPKQLKKHGLNKNMLRITDDAIREVITGYTRESGVRNLERELAGVCRKAAKKVATDGVRRVTVKAGQLEEYLGVRKYHPETQRMKDEVGVVTGLAWTSVGGEVLEVEVNVVDGTGKLELTGNLGNVMQESVKAAVSYIRSRCSEFGIPADFHKTKDIHVHFPEGAVPKDGPSAGITVCTAIVSALTGAPVRRDLAMTGEISLRGRVMAIGGLKEKTMAALRNGVKTVIIPAENEPDLADIDPLVRSALSFITVSTADAVIHHALDLPKESVSKEEMAFIPTITAADESAVSLKQ